MRDDVGELFDEVMRDVFMGCEGALREGNGLVGRVVGAFTG